MKTKTYIILLCMTSLWYAGLEATPINILFTDGVKLTIRDVQLTPAELEDWKQQEDQLQSMFYTYNLPENIEAYKAVFYQNKFPSHIAEVYDGWRAQMETISLHPQAIFYGTLDNLDVAFIQYSFSQQGNDIQMSFIAKRINGIWYPADTKENAIYQGVMGLVATLSPELTKAMVHPESNNPLTETAKALLKNCSVDGNSITEECLYSTGEKWGTSSDPIEQAKEKQLFKSRLIQHESESVISAKMTSLKSYVQGLTIPEEAKQKVMYYFSKNESMKAISTMYTNGLSMEKKTLFDDLNRVQQTSAYKTYQVVIPEKPQSN